MPLAEPFQAVEECLAGGCYPNMWELREHRHLQGRGAEEACSRGYSRGIRLCGICRNLGPA